MIVYLIPAILLSLLSCLENKINYQLIIKNKYFYLLILSFFIFFIGFRSQIGCDWQSYIDNFNTISFEKWSSFTFKKNSNFFDIGYSIISKLISYKFDFKFLVLLISSIFTIPLFIFCYQLKRTYLSLLISYPYLFVVIGMGPFRQSAAISLAILSVLLLLKNNYFLFYIFSFLSTLFHSSAIIFTSFFLIKFTRSNKKIYESFFGIIFILGIFFITFYNFDFVLSKINHYFMNYVNMTKAKSAIFIWLINFLPMTLYFTNIKKFNFNRSIHKICIFFIFYEIFFFFMIFINSIIAYRFLLYCFPVSIYITSYIPDVQIYKIKNDYIVFILIFLSNSTLMLWLKFANHSYCWLPYQNIIFN